MKLDLILKSALFVLASAFALPAADSDGVVRMAGHVPQTRIAAATHLGRLNPQQNISLALPLKPRDEAGLVDYIRRIHTSGDPLYGRYLTPQEFTTRFGPSDADALAVAAYAQSLGLEVTAIHPNNLLVDVEGTSSAVEHAFSLEMHSYQTTDGRTVYAPNVNPSLRSDIATRLHGVVGLNNFTKHTHAKKSVRLIDSSAAKSAHFTGSGLGGTMIPSDIKKAYNLTGVTQTGTGQTMALIEYDGYLSSDITAYKNATGLTSTPTLQNVLIDGFSGTPTSMNAATSGALEVTLDIDMMIALAPGATKIIVYEGVLDNSDAHWLNVFSRAASDNLAQTISNSWGGDEAGDDSPTVASENTIFEEMATQGQSIFTASGDSGAYDDGSYGTTNHLSIDDPGAQPYMVAVGGTKLNLNSDGSYASESSWGNPDEGGDPSGSGGGVSLNWTIPAWQANTSMATNNGSTTHRNVPDVSLNADPASGYLVAFNGYGYIVGGTSAAAPLWAAFTTLVNQARVANGLAVLGFANPSLYLVGNSSLYPICFQDVTAGTNLHYAAVSGYDLATGYGSFNGANLLSVLSTDSLPPAPPTNLSVVITQ